MSIPINLDMPLEELDFEELKQRKIITEGMLSVENISKYKKLNILEELEKIDIEMNRRFEECM